MEFTTSRLRVRSFAREDEEALHRLLSDPAVMRWMEPPYSPAQTRAFLLRAGLCQPPLVYAAESLSTNCIIGYVIYHPYIQPSDYEIGWALAPCHWGKGLATSSPPLCWTRPAAKERAGQCWNVCLKTPRCSALPPALDSPFRESRRGWSNTACLYRTFPQLLQYISPAAQRRPLYFML